MVTGLRQSCPSVSWETFHALPRYKNILKRLIPLGDISETHDLAFCTVPLYNYNVQQVKDFLKVNNLKGTPMTTITT